MARLRDSTTCRADRTELFDEHLPPDLAQQASVEWTDFSSDMMGKSVEYQRIDVTCYFYLTACLLAVKKTGKTSFQIASFLGR